MQKNDTKTAIYLIIILIISATLYFVYIHKRDESINLADDISVESFVDDLREPVTRYVMSSAVQYPYVAPQQLNSLEKVENPYRYHTDPISSNNRNNSNSNNRVVNNFNNNNTYGLESAINTEFSQKTTDKVTPYYDLSWYPNLALPSSVIGCGGRGQSCYGGTQIAIPNLSSALNISDQNIAPSTLFTHGYNRSYPNKFCGNSGGYRDRRSDYRQVGVIYRIFGANNVMYPLYGRRNNTYEDKWNYYTVINDYRVPVITNKNYTELGINDEVTLPNMIGKYRVTVYADDFPDTFKSPI